jgi:hypothetical protein
MNLEETYKDFVTEHDPSYYESTSWGEGMYICVAAQVEEFDDEGKFINVLTMNGYGAENGGLYKLEHIQQLLDSGMIELGWALEYHDDECLLEVVTRVLSPREMVARYKEGA